MVNNNRERKRNELKIVLDFEINSIYLLGYMLNELSQILVYCEMIENDYPSIDITTFSNSYYIYRDPIVRELSKKYKIKSINNGSIEIVIACASVFAAIVIPLISVAVAHRLKKRDQMIVFNIESAYPSEVKYIIDKFKSDYGFDDENINYLFDRLSREYNITCDKDHIHIVARTLDDYVNRITKTVYAVSKYK